MLSAESTGPIFTKNSHDVDIIYTVNAHIEIAISHFFQNAGAITEEGIGNFATKLVAMATSLEESEKEVRIEKIHSSTFHLVKRS